MNAKTTISITEARKQIFDIAKAVQRPGARYTLTENGRPKAVIMSAEEYESWAETLEVMKDFPDLQKDVAEADRAVETGAYKKWATLDDMKGRYGLLIADKPKITYGVRSARKTKSAKKHR